MTANIFESNEMMDFILCIVSCHLEVSHLIRFDYDHSQSVWFKLPESKLFYLLQRNIFFPIPLKTIVDHMAKISY